MFDRPPVTRVQKRRGTGLSAAEWPASIPAVAQLLRDGLDLEPGVTLLVGENGSGKSTLVEAVAAAFGLSPEGGSNQGSHQTYATESPLAGAIELQRGLGSPRWGFFLRAETMHGWFTAVEERAQGADRRDPHYHELSHGESFLEVLRRRFDSPGFYCLDEPEAALSFSSSLALVGALHDVVRMGGQVLCATHSPLLAAMPGATLLEVGEWGLRRTTWEELELVQHWRAYLQEPGRYLRHVVEP